MQLDDIPDVLVIDQLAFEIEWQNSLEALKLAFLQSTSATIVELDGKILGYQISTLGSMGGHIARLAVHTDYRGQGNGKMLLEDVLSQFARRGINLVTVNTQEENTSALGLYMRAGFRLTGEKFNVYQYPLNSQV